METIAIVGFAALAGLIALGILAVVTLGALAGGWLTVGTAVVGWLIAGPAGAVIGAMASGVLTLFLLSRNPH